MKRARALLAMPAVAVLAACSHPTDVTLQELNVSGTVSSALDGSPMQGVSVAVGYEFVGLFGGGAGSGASVATGADGSYALRYTRPDVGGIHCAPRGFWVLVYLPDGWTVAEASRDSLWIACTEAVQVINVQLTPVP